MKLSIKLDRFNVIFIVIFSVWLFFIVSEKTNLSNRIYSINNYYKNSKILPDDKEDIFLKELIQWLIISTENKNSKWKLNNVISKDFLNINIVSSDIYKYTFTSKDNAVYDTELDAIFIHENLVKGITEIGDGSGNQFTTGWTDRKIYLSFVILHELGHRSLHGKSAALFDELAQFSNDSASKKMEIEADSYAFQSLRRAYKYDLDIGKKFLPNFSDEEYGYITHLRNGSEKDHNIILGLHLAGMIEEWFFNEIRNGEFSPYHYDGAHPNFAFRLKGISQNIDESAYHNRPKNMVLRAKDIISRVDAISNRLVGQVKFPFQTAGVVLGSTKIWGVSELGDWASADISSTDKLHSSKYAKFQALPEDTLPKVPLGKGARVLGMIGDTDGPAILVDHRRYVHIRTASGWNSVKLDAGIKPDISLVYRSIFPIYTKQGNKISGAAVISMRDEQPKQMLVLHLININGSVRERSAESLVSKLIPEFGAIEPELTTFGSANYDDVCLTIYGRSDLRLPKLMGAVVLDHNLGIKRTYKLPDKGTISELSEATVLCPRDKDRLVVIGAHFKTPGFEIWDVVFSKGKFESSVLRGRILHLGERLEGREYAQPRSSFLSAELYGSDDELHIVLRDDGYFIVKPNGESRILFHPGGLVNGILGKLVAVGPGYRGNNVYLVQTDGGVSQLEGEAR